MQVTWQMYVIVLPLIFFASFVDSVAGGGGLISLPAYYLAGLNPYLAAGTNKLSACVGTVASCGKYIASGKASLKVGILAAVMALPGSWLGTLLQLRIPEQTVRIMMLCLIPVVAAVVLTNKNKEQRHAAVPEKYFMAAAAAIGLVIGFYDGLVGPGTGTFLIILFTMLLGMDGVLASGTAKMVNLASNVAALVTYLTAGKVLLALGIPAAFCSVMGGLLGAKMTISKGAGFVRRMMLVVLALLLAKMLFDVVS